MNKYSVFCFMWVSVGLIGLSSPAAAVICCLFCAGTTAIVFDRD